VQVRVGARLDGDPFTVLIAAGRKPPASADRRRAATKRPVQRESLGRR